MKTKKNTLPVWRCCRCNSDRVYLEAYINPNTGESFEAGSDEGYCEECDDANGYGSCRVYRDDGDWT